MVYILVYTVDGKKDVSVLNDMAELTSLLEKLEGIGKQKTINLYEAEQISYKYELEDVEETVIKKVPKVEILK